MPSRAEMRVVLEHVLRGGVITALAVMLWQSQQQPTDSGGETLSARGVGELADWSSSPKPPAGIHVQLDSVPKPRERAWLGALAGAGTRVTWSGDVPAVMIDDQPVASPTGGTRVLVAAPRRSLVVISDDVGPIDTVQAQLAGVTLALGSVAGELTARVDGSTASTVQRDSVSLRKVLVIGSAGWESKFVVAALEEEGWKVDAFIRVAPGVDVKQGSGAMIDTSRYSAVIALDGAALPYANRIIEFARTGGGVVLAPQAARLDALGPIRAGAIGRAAVSNPAIEAGGTAGLATLALTPITTLRNEAIPLGTQGGAVATAARRIGAGRVVQLGYDDTWLWRMGGGYGAVREHRSWWTRLVSNVACTPTPSRTMNTAATDEAPTIGLIDGVGIQTPTTALSSVSGTATEWMVWLFMLLAVGLVGEAASRRLRGTS